MDKGPSKILVTGATGYIGGRLIPRLVDKGYAVRCLARHSEALAGRNWKGVEVVQGDVLDPGTLKNVFVGVDAAYYLIHSMRAGEAGFRERDRLAAENFAKAAAEAGVKRIIYLGGLGSESEILSVHLQSRHEVGNILRRYCPDTTEFRAAVIVGSGSLSFEMIRYLTERLPLMICPRWLNSRIQPIAVRDVLSYLVQALETSESEGQVLEIGGADVVSYGDMLRQYAEVRGLRRYFINVPVLTPRLSSYWVDLVTPIPASISRPLIEGLRNDVVCRDFKARKLFEIRPMTYRQAVKLALDRVSQDNIETVWSGSLASLGRYESSVTLLETRQGMITEIRILRIRSSAEKVFRIVAGIGGKRGWFYCNWLWRVRGLLDRLAGGVGMRRGRRHPDELRVGDALDFWRVEVLERNQRIRLRAEMKLPGKAWLQFEMVPIEDQHVMLRQTAFFDPKGLLGLVYWYVLYPVHRMIFSGLSREIRRRAEA